MALRLLFFARVILSVYLFLPYLVVYGQHVGLDFATLMLVEAIFAILVVLIDLPTGHLADRIGPRQALIFGACSEAVASLLLGLVPRAETFWLTQPFFALAAALCGGADSALTAGLLVRGHRGDEFEDVERAYYRTILVVGAVGMVASAPLAALSLQAPFLATGVLQLVAVGLLLFVPNVPSRATLDDASISLRQQFHGLIAELRSSGLARDLVAMILTGTAFSVLLYLLPMFYTNAGASIPQLGLVAAGVAVMSSLFSRVAGNRLGPHLVLATATITSLLLDTHILPVVILAAVFIQFGQTVLMPLFKTRVLSGFRHTGESMALSIVTTTRNVGFALIAPALGTLMTAWGMTGLGWASALLFATAAVLLSRSATATETSSTITE
ncbi:hypothetical protein HMPREF1531_01106 [Propionibacterium sp. oral taxon 192 str. F0372]|uniref:MFS transporter n=1 Tax=Propionibacterium sp. oral taxon 192 TaxID=671222 RepID=UPI000353552A|nr:MFS transporter [Propionibacterium sp. oral taxon 192]EPH04391.1 hypothetical protein HMPREF1531_01106 [Propionibacterium sp. oral taxon 192 str. F0372]